MSKGYTPGPWKMTYADAEQAEDERYWVGTDNNQFIEVHHTMQEWDEWQANATLIATAPDLLETLTALLQVVKTAGHSNTDLFPCHQTNAEEAIAKATGVKQEEDK